MYRFHLSLLALVFLFLTVYSPVPSTARAEEKMPSLEELKPESYRGKDPRSKVYRRANNPWFGLNEQSRCPVSGRRFHGKAKGRHHIDYKGYRFFLSDSKLKWIFRKYPNRAIRQLYDWGMRPQRLDLCQVCGEIHSSKKCCSGGLEVKRCEECQKYHRSPGCCLGEGYVLELPKSRKQR